MKTFYREDSGQLGGLGIIVTGVIAIIVGAAMLYVGLFVTASIGSAVGSTLTPDEASGVLTLTGNASCGDYINVTNIDGVLVPFRINMSAGCAQIPSNADVALINITQGNNQSHIASLNISGSFNANSTIASTMTATNSSNSTVTLTYNTVGTTGNRVLTSETMANGAWGDVRFTGGVEGASGYASMKSNVNTAFSVLGLVLLIGGFGLVISQLRQFGGTQSAR